MEKSPLVTIVIVSFNTQELLLSCIASIEKWVKSTHEIIVVDNASADGSVSAVLGLKNKNIVLLQNKTNVGFAKANNQAFAKANGKYILMLNSDTYLTEDSVTSVLRLLQHNPKIGVASCRLNNNDKSLQPTGGYFPTLFRLFAWMSFVDDIPGFSEIIRPVHPTARFYRKSCELDWVTGAFLMFPKSILKKAYGLDEDYFMYVEELDFCYRVKKLEFTVSYLHEASVVHLGRGSSTNEFAITSEFKNIVLFYKKHFPHLVNFARIILKGGCILRITLFAILGKSTEQKIYEKTLNII